MDEEHMYENNTLQENGMRTQSSDTSPEAERVQIDLLRKAGVVRRIELAFSLTQSAIELSRQGMRRRYPLASEEDLNLLFVELNYGKELADRVRTALSRREL
ncbi:MAG: hypothetical protein ABI406_09645 [Ktedonobacteraceae bacterium]